MPVDLKKLDDKIRKLQQIRELASDPEMALLLNDIISPNGNGTKKEATPTVGSANPDGVTAYAIKAIAAVAGTFTTNDLVAKMKELGYHFTAKDPAVATYSVMMRLKEKGVISVIEKGGPGKLAKWAANGNT